MYIHSLTTVNIRSWYRKGLYWFRITIVVLFGGGLMLNNFGVFLSIMTIISFKAYRISFFSRSRVTKFAKQEEMCTYFYLCQSVFAIKKFLLPNITGYNFCVLNMLRFKSDSKKKRKLDHRGKYPDIRYCTVCILLPSI